MAKQPIMMSFFCKSGGSGQIRGVQMSEYLGAKLNPTSGFDDDVCIYVKMEPPEDYPKNTYLDIIDEPRRVKWLRKHPDVKVIASSLSGYLWLKAILKNKIIFIPQHHCNFNREVSPWNGGKIGVIGGNGAVQIELPFEYLHQTEYKTRKDVVDFYKKIDIQVVWRSQQNRPLKNPLKIINAMSFGVPTIAHQEVGYQDVRGFYLCVYTADEIVEQLNSLDRGKFMMSMIENGLEKAEEYHIDNIAKKYLELL